MKKVIILAALCLLGQTAQAQIREFQTSRMMSMAGAGTASILSTESAVLNPASSAFFDGSSFSYQDYKTALKNKNSLRSTSGESFPNTNRSQGVFVADHSGPLKGGVAYLLQDENNFERKRMVFHGAAPIGSSTSMGLGYSYIQDRLPRKYPDRNKSHHQATLGLTHILDQDTVVALVLLDPTRATKNEERAIAGFQYNLAERFTIIGDVGAQFTKNVSKKYFWKAGVQINIFSDFFLKAGKFYDNITEFQGTGWGVSWIGPRIGVEFSQKYSEQFGSGNYLYKDEELTDTSLSALIKF